MGGGDMEFLRRIEELAASAGVQMAGCGWPPSVEHRRGYMSHSVLLVNFTVHSMSHSVAAAAIPPTPPTAAAAAVVDAQHTEPSTPRFDATSLKTFSIGRTASVGGGNRGGGDAQPVAGTPVEASSMQADARVEELTDPELLGNLVSPVVAEMETEDVVEYARTEQRYELAVSEEPNNSLILANFAQFLYLTRNDHKRAEHYFERAVQAEPTDAEALSRYATFLWQAWDDVAAAEETYQEAIGADPGNAHYAAAYAHFL